jgi:hypothetical protein
MLRLAGWIDHVSPEHATRAASAAVKALTAAVSPSPHGSRRRAGGESGDIDPLRVDRVVAHGLARDSGDEGGFATVALLVTGAEPIPAFRTIAGYRLSGGRASPAAPSAAPRRAYFPQIFLNGLE